LTKTCTKPKEVLVPRDIYRDRIIKLNNSKDSTKQEVKKQDVARVKIIVKWRTKIADTIYKPCDSLVLICNEIITVDSTEISSLKHLNQINDSIINTQKIMLRDDSLDKICLKKQIQKQKRQKALAITGLIIVGSTAVLK